MQLIPVLDLMRGQVVRAVRGERSTYQPLRSCLCDGAQPLPMARAMAAHCASPLLYVADLDALQGGARQTEVVAQLLADDPARQCWVDGGFADAGQARAWLRELGPLAARVRPVFGSESLRDAQALRELNTPDGAPEGVLSLDRRDGQVLDAAGGWGTPQAWPQRLIMMTLERVGAGQGPDLTTLAMLRSQRPDVCLVGAGGIRHAADLAAAAAAGAQAWLVASALHDGSLPAMGSPAATPAAR